MEAMWTACHPVVSALRDRLADGELGTPRQLRAELGFVVSAGPDDRLLDPALGASALLDMGIYPLTLAQLLLGEPEELTATAVLSDAGIDLDVAIAGRYPGGALATMSASMTSWSDRSAAIATDRGRIELEGQFHHPERAVFRPYLDGSTNDRSGYGEPVVIEGSEPVLGRGYAHEVAEVDRCVRAGLRESPLVPHAQTLAVMRQLDDVRRQVGVTYPADGHPKGSAPRT
jgi:predicted dehydrogenase